MSSCSFKHTKFQPDSSQWRCPNCGQDIASFYIISSMNDECPLVHLEDEVICDNCKLSMDGEEVVGLIMEKSELMPCPFCEGKGAVHKDKVK